MKKQKASCLKGINWTYFLTIYKIQLLLVLLILFARYCWSNHMLELLLFLIYVTVDIGFLCSLNDFTQTINKESK